LRERDQRIPEHLGHWLSASHEAEIEQHYETLGKAERRVGRFFDELAIHMVRGYETAWRRAAHAAA
jgi:hypothetical protein